MLIEFPDAKIEVTVTDGVVVVHGDHPPLDCRVIAARVQNIRLILFRGEPFFSLCETASIMTTCVAGLIDFAPATNIMLNIAPVAHGETLGSLPRKIGGHLSRHKLTYRMLPQERVAKTNWASVSNAWVIIMAIESTEGLAVVSTLQAVSWTGFGENGRLLVGYYHPSVMIVEGTTLAAALTDVDRAFMTGRFQPGFTRDIVIRVLPRELHADVVAYLAKKLDVAVY